MYSEPSRTSKMEFSANILKEVLLLTIFVKSSILDAQLGSKYASGMFNLSWTKRIAIALMAKSCHLIDLTAKMVCVHKECK